MRNTAGRKSDIQPKNLPDLSDLPDLLDLPNLPDLSDLPDLLDLPNLHDLPILPDRTTLFILGEKNVHLRKVKKKSFSNF